MKDVARAIGAVGVAAIGVWLWTAGATTWGVVLIVVGVFQALD